MEGTLVFDFGTTALKTVLFDEHFRVAAKESREFAYLSPETGRMECDPYQYARTMFETGREVLAKGSARRIAVTGQAETLIFLDAAGEAVGPAIVWLDDRAKGEAKALGAKIPRETFYARTGNPGVDPVMPLAKLAWVKKHLPALDAQYTKALLLHDWALYLLTGRICAEYSTLSCSGYFDVRRKRYDAEILKLAGIDEARLAEAMPPSVEIGGIASAAASMLGIAAGTPVSGGMLDQGAPRGRGCGGGWWRRWRRRSARETYGRGC